MFRSLTEYFDFLKTTGISMQKAYVLTYLYCNGPCKITAICEHMLMSAAGASQMVNRLEKQDCVKRTTDPGDRRVRNVVLTEQTEIFVKQSIAVRQNWVNDIQIELSSEQLDQITSALLLLTSVYQVEISE